MELTLKRTTRTEISTTGELSINGNFFSYVLEDKDRWLKNTMPLAEILKKKIHSKTAIPAGRYEVVMTYSERFKKYLPLLLNVPGYEGVRIHNGSFSSDTEGCLLVGFNKQVDFINGSVKALTALLKQLTAVEKKEKIFITIV